MYVRLPDVVQCFVVFSVCFSLLVTHLKLEGHADISHNELVLLQVDTKLDKGELDARGGVIAGAMLVENIQAHGEREIIRYRIAMHMYMYL